jgi:hypothetical protein
MKITTKAEAIKQGLKEYNGEECRKCHTTKRYTNSGKCIKCHQARNAARKRGKAKTGAATKKAVEPVTATSTKLERIGREIRARVERLDRIGARAVDMVDSIKYLLREAEQLCDGPDGFIAFKQTYCPELGRSRTYELLAVERGRKTVEQIRAAGRERVAKHRAAQRTPKRGRW